MADEGFTLIDTSYIVSPCGSYYSFFETLEEAQDYLDTDLANFRRKGYVVTELPVTGGQVVMWQLNVNGRDAGTIGIAKGDLAPDDDDYTDW